MFQLDTSSTGTKSRLEAAQLQGLADVEAPGTGTPAAPHDMGTAPLVALARGWVVIIPPPHPPTPHPKTPPNPHSMSLKITKKTENHGATDSAVGNYNLRKSTRPIDLQYIHE